MKKTNTCCKLGLLIWLLSFNTLSSCVNTGQSLGMGLCQSNASKKKKLQKQLSRQIKMNNLNAYRSVPAPKISYNCGTFKIKNYISYIVTALGASIIVGETVVYIYKNYFSPDSVPSEPNPMEEANNNTMLSLTGNGTTSLINTTLSCVGTTATAVATTLATTAAGLIPKLKPNHTTSTAGPPSNEEENRILDAIENPKWNQSSTTGESKPSDIKLTSLTQEIIDDIILQHRFSIKRIKYWLSQGLSINATDADGRTLLMEGANNISLRVVKFLIGKGVNVNAKDNRGNTALMYALDRGPEAQPIVDYLIKHGATPCTKNVDGRPSSSDINLFDVKLLKEKFKKCS
ncbi:MAG: ankyrin repeat domain-containing protein [Candidatus Cardinium sp.]